MQPRTPKAEIAKLNTLLNDLDTATVTKITARYVSKLATSLQWGIDYVSDYTHDSRTDEYLLKHGKFTTYDTARIVHSLIQLKTAEASGLRTEQQATDINAHKQLLDTKLRAALKALVIQFNVEVKRLVNDYAKVCALKGTNTKLYARKMKELYREVRVPVKSSASFSPDELLVLPNLIDMPTNLEEWQEQAALERLAGIYNMLSALVVESQPNPEQE